MILFSSIISFLILFIICYPFIEILKGKCFKKNLNNPEIEIKKPISIIISVFNEERYIQTKIDEILNEDIWIEGTELIIVSAGSTDKTNEILKLYSENSKLRTIIKEEHLLKIESINLAVDISKNEFLLFSDCRQTMKKGAIALLMNTLIIEKAGIAAGTLVNIKNGKPHQSFRKWLNTMNVLKAKRGSSMNVYGALYAIHRSSYRPIPTNVLFDDLYVLASVLSQNKKIIQVENAIIYEVNFDTYYQEERIQRLTRGLMIFWFNHFQLIRKMPLKYRYHFIMSKYSKLTLPLLFITASILNLIIILRQNNYIYNAIVLSVISICLLLFLLSPFIRLSFKLIFYTLKSEYLFIFKNQRSIRWEKLKH
jgi:glycosyltransferase involved in cell wall biosynthesis